MSWLQVTSKQEPSPLFCSCPLSVLSCAVQGSTALVSTVLAIPGFHALHPLTHRDAFPAKQVPRGLQSQQEAQDASVEGKQDGLGTSSSLSHVTVLYLLCPRTTKLLGLPSLIFTSLGTRGKSEAVLSLNKASPHQCLSSQPSGTHPARQGPAWHTQQLLHLPRDAHRASEGTGSTPFSRSLPATLPPSVFADFSHPVFVLSPQSFTAF